MVPNFSSFDKYFNVLHTNIDKTNVGSRQRYSKSINQTFLNKQPARRAVRRDEF